MIALVVLLLLHSPDQKAVEINTDQIVALRVPRQHERQINENVHCLVITADGKFISVIETCDAIRDMIRKPE